MTTYLKAKDIMSMTPAASTPIRNVEASMPVLEVLPRLLDTPDHTLGVVENSEFMGVISENSLLEGLGRMLAPRDDSSIISLQCSPEDFSASRIAHAIEDAGAHLVDLLTVPAKDGMLLVTLRVRHTDPSSAISQLERYGFKVTDASGSSFVNAEIAAERLLALNTFLNI